MVAHQKDSHKVMPHVKNGRFFNHADEHPKGFLLHTIYMFFKNRLMQKKACPRRIAHWVDKEPLIEVADKPVITWIGHSTFLIRYAGVTILTDPVFGHASFLYRRIMPAGLLPHELPHIDILLLSHNHRDHMDAESLLALKNQPFMKILVPQGDKGWFTSKKFTDVQEYTWWQEAQIPIERSEQQVKITFLPAIHWSQRGFFDKNRSLWGSWMIQIKDRCFYFAGDTSYSTHFSAIAQEFPTIDTVFMPIGPCEPRVWMEHAHISAHQAGQAFLDLKARHFVPMHWGTFPFGVDRFETPIEYLLSWWQQSQGLLQNSVLHLPKIGKHFIVK